MGDSEGPGVYGPKWFHPVHLGDTIQDRYRVLRKLGYGRYSTVWLAKDLRSHNYVALKVIAAWSSDTNQHEAQLLRSLRPSHDQEDSPVIPLLESFALQGVNGTHNVLVLPPVGRTLGELILAIDSDRRVGGFWLPLQRLRALSRRMATAVDYIHTKSIMHCDIQPSNFVFALQDSLDGLEAGNIQHGLESCPSDHIFPIDAEGLGLHGTSRGSPRYLVEPMRLEDDVHALTPDRLLLTDFGSSAAFKDMDQRHLTYPVDARTPEQVLGCSVDASADIWALGCAIFQVVTLSNPFYVDGFMEGTERDDENLQSMVEVLGGPMPRHLLNKWTNSGASLDEHGDLLPGQLADPFSLPLHEHIAKYKPSDMSCSDALMFEDMIRAMLRWDPQRRPSAREVLLHPWLQLSPV